MNDLLTGRHYHVDGRLLPIKPWRRSCWDEEGRPVLHGPDCHHHDEWRRVAGCAILAWVARSVRRRGRLDVCVWDSALEDFAEVFTTRGKRFVASHNPALLQRSARWAKVAADKALLEVLEADHG